MFTVRITTTPIGLAERFASAPARLKPLQLTLMKKLQLFAANQASDRAPRWTNDLADSMYVGHPQSASVVTYLLATVAPRAMGYGATYEAAQEEGGSWYPPYRNLIPWVEGKLLVSGSDVDRAAYFVSQAIGSRGLPAHHFMVNAYEMLEGVLFAEMESTARMMANLVMAP